MESSESKNSRIFINPKFKGAYINPNFIASTTKAINMISKPNKIHLNPKFLEVLKQQNAIAESTLKRKVAAPIIQNTKRKLIRKPASPLTVAPHLPFTAPMIKIGKNKLVRSNINATPTKVFHPAVRKVYNIVNKTGSVKKRKTIIKKYSLIRADKDQITPKKVVITDRKLLKKRNFKPASSNSTNKKLEMININGVLYKSTKNKLQKSSPVAPKTIESLNKDRILIVRGVKFVLEANGSKLQRVDNKLVRMKRIDIGGLTYVSKNDGTFIKTNSHRTRSYLSIAKQKSINVLSNKMTKCNVPCPIYRKIGKCLAFTRGKCPKVHDPKLVSICAKFLRGDCSNENCLLSHNVTLEKMPTCKFFLLGCCVKPNCPYLHKKVSDDEEICQEFLKGFCPLAEKCKKRHEYLCPEDEGSKGTWKKGNKSKCVQSAEKEEEEMVEKEKAASRYYIEKDSGELSEFRKLQLKRMLKQVDKMKCTSSDSVVEISDSDSDEVEAEPIPFKKRPKVGILPSFIPL